MNKDIRKLIKKVDGLQRLLNHQNESIMDQSIIIQKLIEKLVVISTYPSTPSIGPYVPPYKGSFTWPCKGPDRNTDSGTPYVPNNIICHHCHKDTGIAMNLCMIVPPEGLKCPHCGKIVVQSNTTTISDAPNINTSTTNFDPSIKGYNNRTTTPITFKSYDGTKSTLPVNTLPDREWYG
jgi:hypothetical protein